MDALAQHNNSSSSQRRLLLLDLAIEVDIVKDPQL
jgi:hypothetical protein